MIPQRLVSMCTRILVTSWFWCHMFLPKEFLSCWVTNKGVEPHSTWFLGLWHCLHSTHSRWSVRIRREEDTGIVTSNLGLRWHSNVPNLMLVSFECKSFLPLSILRKFRDAHTYWPKTSPTTQFAENAGTATWSPISATVTLRGW